MAVQLVGSKGVGKSTCLYALSLELIENCESSQSTEDQYVILYFTERSLLDETILNGYLEYCGLNCKLDSLAGKIIEDTVRNFVILVDLGKHDDNYSGNKLMEFVRPLLGSYSHFKVILAHSSGEGINEHHKTFFKEVKDSGAVKVTLCNFSEAEAQTYCDKFNLHIPLNDLKEKTNFNPYLLQAATQAKKAHWKDKYDQVLLTHINSEIQKEVEKYTNSSFDVLENFSKYKSLAEQFQKIDYFLYYARTHIPLDIKDLGDFLNSWVYQDGHCYILDYDNDTAFTISLNFPNSDRLISDKITQLVTTEDVPEVITGALLGYRFESEFYNACLRAASITISYGENKSLVLTLNTCDKISREDKDEWKFTKNFLYRLYDTHPAIDFVGEFEVNKSSYLVMFQLSVSNYTSHQSKVRHLNRTYQNYTEFKKKTVLDYYKSLCNETKMEVLFIYVSPKHNTSIPKIIRQHAQKEKLKIDIGLITGPSACPIFNVISKFNLYTIK